MGQVMSRVSIQICNKIGYRTKVKRLHLHIRITKLKLSRTLKSPESKWIGCRSQKEVTVLCEDWSRYLSLHLFIFCVRSMIYLSYELE